MIRLSITILVVSLSVFPLFAQEVDVAWVKRYNGSANAGENALDLEIDDSGNVYITGYSPGYLTSADYATIKYYPDGETAWVRRYNGPVNAYDAARALTVDVSGNVFVTGNSPGSGTSDDITTIKYTPEGKQKWLLRYDGLESNTDRATDIIVAQSGNIYVTGVSGAQPNVNYVTIKYNKKGDELWSTRYNGPGHMQDEARIIAVDGSENIYVTGASVGDQTSFDFATIKYSKKGDELWVRRYDGPVNGFDEAIDMVLDATGNIYVAGGSDGEGKNRDYLTIKYLPDGDTAWVRRYNGPGNSYDQIHAITVDDSGNVYVTGESLGKNGSSDYATIKYYPDGGVAWVERYEGSGKGNDYAKAIALDTSSNVYITGFCLNAETSYDYVTIKYQPDGKTAWVKTYNGTGNKVDWAADMAVDAFNNIYVTGRSDGSGTAYDYATIKYTQFTKRIDTLFFFAYSTVDLIIKDPKGDSIGVNFNTIPQASYNTGMDIDQDGRKDDKISIPEPVAGEYLFRITPEPGAANEHYSLTVKMSKGEEQYLIILHPIPEQGKTDTLSYTLSR